MLYENLKNILLTEIEDEEFVTKTDKGYYSLWGSGFTEISKADLKKYTILDYSELCGLEIIDIRSAYGTLLIKFSNQAFIQYAYTGISFDSNGYYVLEIKRREEIDDDFINWFENNYAYPQI